MSVINQMDASIERMQSEEIRLSDFINQNSVKAVTDTQLENGVDRLLYNHAINKTNLTTFCNVSSPTFNKRIKELSEAELIAEPFVQGKSHLYNRFDVQRIIESFHLPAYRDNYQSCVVSIQNHKGGVGKSTTTRTLATAAALDLDLNARIAVVDLDPQGSCGLQGQPKDENGIFLTVADIALRDVEPNSRFYEYLSYFDLSQEEVVLHAAVNTHLPNLDIFTAFPEDERFSDYYHSLDNDGQVALLHQLRDFVLPILKTEYDIIFIDTPPQDSPVCWSVLEAADFLLTPIAPKELDYLSTKNFVRFTRERIKQLPSQGENLKLWKVVSVNVDVTSRQQNRMLSRIRRAFVDAVMANSLESSELFIAADGLHRTIFDIQKSEARDFKYAGPKAYDRAIDSAGALYREFRGLLLNMSIGGDE